MLYDESLRIDMDEMAPAYFAGLLGKGTTNLPVSAVETCKSGYSTTYTFKWTLNTTTGMPEKIYKRKQNNDGHKEKDEIEFKW